MRTCQSKYSTRSQINGACPILVLIDIFASLCEADARTSERLGRRKACIRKFMFRSATSLVPNEPLSALPKAGVGGIWVDGDFLRNFLRCDSSLDHMIKDSGHPLPHLHLLCEHGHLHPRVFRRGKLVPLRVYTTIIALLREERRFLLGRSDEEQKCNDHVMPSLKNMHCVECAGAYRAELSGKIQLLRNIKQLYDALESKIHDAVLPYDKGEGEEEDPKNAFAYAVSRQSVTKFKKGVLELFKSMARAGEGSIVVPDDHFGATALEGIDTLDMSMFDTFEKPVYEERCMEHSVKLEEKSRAEKSFNGNITCKSAWWDSSLSHIKIPDNVCLLKACMGTALSLTTGVWCVLCLGRFGKW